MSVQIQVRSEHRDASPAFGSAHADSGIAARLGTSEVRTTLLVLVPYNTEKRINRG